MFKRFPVFIACGIILLAGTTGCSHQTGSSGADPGHGTLEFPNTGHAPTAAEMQQIMKAHPGPDSGAAAKPPVKPPT